MATKTYTFDSTTEGWSWTPVLGTPSRTEAVNNRIETDGLIGRNEDSHGFWGITGTFTSIFGIGSTDDVTAITNAAFNGTVVSLFPNGGSKTSTVVFGDSGSNYAFLMIVNSSNNHTLISPSGNLQSLGATYNPNVNPNITGLSYTGSDSVELRLYGRFINGNDADGEGGAGWDNVSITITSSASTAGYIKVWTGSQWVMKPVKYWTGSQWTQKPLKFWNGSQWTLT